MALFNSILTGGVDPNIMSNSGLPVHTVLAGKTFTITNGRINLVYGDFTIEAGATLNINEGGKLVVINGSVNNNGGTINNLGGSEAIIELQTV